MPDIRRHLLAAIALLASGAAIAGEITLFEYPDYGGRRITLRGAISNFDPTGFNDRASSMVIREGYWEVCSDAYFRGHCATFGPGEYRGLQHSLTETISSAREVAAAPPAPPPVRPPSAIVGDGTPRIELWERREFGGRSIVLTSGVPDFERIGFNDRADAAVVYGGVWRLCEHAGLGGRCQEYGPGRYNDLGYLGGKVSSAAIAGGIGGGGGGHVPPGRPRVVLYEYPNFGGRSFAIEGDVVSNLDPTGFNDRAASRIHEQYPHNAAPVWGSPR
jgi:Beta/Gamma crystallin